MTIYTDKRLCKRRNICENVCKNTTKPVNRTLTGRPIPHFKAKYIRAFQFKSRPNKPLRKL